MDHVVAAAHAAMVATGLPASIGGRVAPLPAAPALEVALFESPLAVVFALVVLSLAAFFVLRSRGGAAFVGAGVGLALAAGVFVVSVIVTTPRERMSSGTRELVRAAVEVDAGALRELLAPDARLVSGKFRSVAGMDSVGREQIISGVEDVVGQRYGVEKWAVLKVQATRDGPNVGRTQVQVRVEAGGMSFSWWKIDWRLEDDGVWRVVGIEPLFISGVGG